MPKENETNHYWPFYCEPFPSNLQRKIELYSESKEDVAEEANKEERLQPEGAILEQEKRDIDKGKDI